MLIDNGADVHAKHAVPDWREAESQEWKQRARENGEKPLYFAIESGHKEVAELLRRHDRTSGKEKAKGTYPLGGPGPNGGIVFDVDASDNHGLEANSQDGGSVTWSRADEALARSGGGRLPTVRELELLFKRKGLVGGFKDGFYWSSEVGAAMSFKSGTVTQLRAHHDSHGGIDAAYVRGIHEIGLSDTTVEPSSNHEIDKVPASPELPRGTQPGSGQKLTRSDLPETIYIPAITLGSMGYSYAQYPDDDGRPHVPVFASDSRATQWLALGKQLWIERRDPRQGFVSRQFHVRREKSTVFDSGLFRRHLVDFEPDPGSLFAPKERTIEILIPENLK